MFACLYAPDFSVQAALLSQMPNARESLRNSPIAILDDISNLTKVVALNDAARNRGIEVGMTKLQVETCDGGIILRNKSTSDEDSAHVRLLEYANSFSPVVESACADAVLLDLAGTEKLFGTAKNKAQRMSENACKCGFHLRVAVASNPDTALYAVRGFKEITVIPKGQEAHHLACLNVELLPLTPEIQDVLKGWGIYTFKSFADLPEISLAERLGQHGLHLQRLARGQIKRGLFPAQPRKRFIQSYEFDSPVESLEPLSFVLNRLLCDVFSSLISQALSTNEIRLTLALEVRQHLTGKNGESFEHVWKLPAPTQDAKMVLALMRLELERHTFVAPISQVTIEALPVKSQTAQGNLFAPPAPETGQFEISVAQIRAVVGDVGDDGKKCFGSPELIDMHKPGCFSLRPLSTFCDVVTSSERLSSKLFLERFSPPLATSVELNGQVPTTVLLWGRSRRVLEASGPWCTSGNWWEPEMVWKREDWEVALKTHAGVGFFRIYRDRLRNQWFVEGLLG